jgi:hypothetical protein
MNRLTSRITFCSNTETFAHASLWLYAKRRDFELIAIPLLRISPSAALSVSVKGWAALQDAQLQTWNEGATRVDHDWTLVHTSTPLSEPEGLVIKDVAVVIGFVSLLDNSWIIAETAAMLRGERS